MTATYEKIATNTLGSATATVTFSSISASYTDLVLVCSIQNTLTGDLDTRYNLRVGNGSIDTGSNYSNTFIIGTGVTAASSRNTGRAQIDGIINTPTANSNEFALVKFDFLNYSNTTTYKTILYRDGKTQNTQEKGAGAGTGIWRSTSAINTLSIFTSGPSAGTFSVGSTFTIYGILKEA
jgi:hypothetical protein